MPVRVTVPLHAAVGDTLGIMTQLGAFEVPMPPTAKPGKELDILVPVPPNSGLTKLVCAFIQVRRDGKEVMAPAPKPRSSLSEKLSPPFKIGSSKNVASPAASNNVRKVTVAVPAGAKAGDTLSMQTDAGVFEMQMPAGVTKTFMADIDVEEGAPAQLTVAWVRIGAMKDVMQAAAEATKAAATLSAPAEPPAADPASAFMAADDADDGEPAADEDEGKADAPTAAEPKPLWGPPATAPPKSEPSSPAAPAVPPAPKPAPPSAAAEAKPPAEPPKPAAPPHFCAAMCKCLK